MGGLPQLLDLGAPRLLGYPAAATLAEKLHAIVTRGLANSRMKDYYDLWTAQRLVVTTPEQLGTAIRHTFGRRATPCPTACLKASPTRSPRRNVRSGRS